MPASPSHSGNPSSAQDQVVSELCDAYAELLRRGEAPSIDQYVTARPELADHLRPALIALRMLLALGEQSPQPAAGSVLGDYRILRQVARGGMGIVYEAMQLSLGRKVAIKVLAQESIDQNNDAAMARFQNEILASSSLEHPNIVPIYSVEHYGRFHFYSMKWIEGKDWSQWKEKDPAIVAAAVYRIALGLQYAHSRGVIHRDIKPSNLLRDDTGHVWIVDFGLAHFPAATTLTATGELVGTIRYMSPEQAQSGSKRVDERSDIYSLGATFYEALIGAPLVTASSPTDQINCIMSGRRPRLRDIRPEIPRQLELILCKMLAFEVDDRYQSALEVAQDLERFLSDRRVTAKLPAWHQQLVRWSRARAGLMLLILMTMTAIGMGLAALIVQLNQTQRQLKRQLVISHLAVAKSHVSSRKPGQRFESLDNLQQAAFDLKSIGQDRELLRQIETTAATALSLSDVRAINHFERPAAGSLDSVVFDGNLDFCTWPDGNRLTISRCNGNTTLASLVLQSPPLTVCFSDDSRLLSILRGPEASPTIEVWDWRRQLRLWYRSADSFSGIPQRFALDICNQSRLLAIGLSNGRVELIGIDDGSTQRELNSSDFPNAPIGQVRFSNSGTRLIAACIAAKRTVVWDLTSGDPLATHQLADDAFAVAWSNDDEMLAIGSGFDISIYSGSNWSTRHTTLSGPREVIANIYFHPSGRWLATYGYDGKTRIWDCDSRTVRLELTGHANGFNPSGDRLAYRTYDGLGLWEFAFDDVVWHQADQKTVDLNPHSLCFAKAGQWIVIGGNGCQIWHVHERARLLILTGAEVSDLAWIEARGELWVATGQGLFRISLEQLERACVAGVDAHDYPWATLSAELIELPSKSVPSLISASSDGRTMACTTVDGGLVVRHSSHNWQSLADSTNRFLFVSVSHDGEFVAASENNSTRTAVWKLGNGQAWEIESPEGGEICFGQVGGQIQLATSEHTRYRVWQILARQAPIHLYDVPRLSGYQKSVVCFCPHLGWLMAFDRTTVQAVDPESRTVRAEFVDGYQDNRGVLFRTSPDGKLLASANAASGFSIWNVDKLPEFPSSR